MWKSPSRPNARPQPPHSTTLANRPGAKQSVRDSVAVFDKGMRREDLQLPCDSCARQLYIFGSLYGQVADTIVTLVTLSVAGFIAPMSCARESALAVAASEGGVVWLGVALLFSAPLSTAPVI